MLGFLQRAAVPCESIASNFTDVPAQHQIALPSALTPSIGSGANKPQESIRSGFAMNNNSDIQLTAGRPHSPAALSTAQTQWATVIGQLLAQEWGASGARNCPRDATTTSRENP
jgi:hypothetical protein